MGASRREKLGQFLGMWMSSPQNVLPNPPRVRKEGKSLRNIQHKESRVDRLDWNPRSTIRGA